MAAASPFFNELPLDQFGLEWIPPSAPLAHPLDDGTAALLERSVDATADGLGPDAAAYRKLFGPLAAAGQDLFGDLLGPFRIPRHPIAAARFGLRALRSARGLAESWFTTERARALIGGVATHSILPLDLSPSAAIGLMLAIAGHAVGWPLPRGGSQRIADA